MKQYLRGFAKLMRRCLPTGFAILLGSFILSFGTLSSSQADLEGVAHNAGCVLEEAAEIIGLGNGCDDNDEGGGSIDVDDTILKQSICALYKLIEGSFGGLIMTVAGIGAVVSAAFGMYRAGYSLLVTGLGAFILRSFVSLWFGDFGCGFGLELIDIGYSDGDGFNLDLFNGAIDLF